MQRMVMVRTGEIIERTDLIHPKYGNPLFRNCNGPNKGRLCGMSLQTHVKPIYTYKQAMALLGKEPA